VIESRGDRRFLLALGVIGGGYLVAIALLIAANVASTHLGRLGNVLSQPAIRHAIQLSLVSSAISTILAMLMAIPLAYRLARTPVRWRGLVEWLVDVPIVLPPVVLGLSLLLVFQSPPGRWLQRFGMVTYAVPAVIIAQTIAVTAFAVRALRMAFDQVSARTEQMAWTLGASREQSFWWIALPEIRGSLLATMTLVWAKALGEFGPVLVFAGTTRFKTEVLATTIFLELGSGELESAIAVALVMIAISAIVLGLVRGVLGRPSLGEVAGGRYM
jgi:molybdate transport system permease protein